MASGKYNGYAVTANLITTVDAKKNKDYYQVDIKTPQNPTDRSYVYTGADATGPNGEKAVIYNNANSNSQTHELGHVLGNNDEYKFNDQNKDNLAQPGEVTESDPGSIMGNHKIHGLTGDGVPIDSRDHHIYRALETAEKENNKQKKNP